MIQIVSISDCDEDIIHHNNVIVVRTIAVTPVYVAVIHVICSALCAVYYVQCTVWLANNIYQMYEVIPVLCTVLQFFALLVGVLDCLEG